MANKIEIIDFNSREELAIRVASDLSKYAQENIETKGYCRMLLSGGTTPKPVYECFASLIQSPEKVLIGLVDERFVPISNDHSNEQMISSALGVGFKIEGMVTNSIDFQDNLFQIRERYKPFLVDTDITILGMGTDGHTASIFPGDEASDRIRKSGEVNIFNTMAPVYPDQRITCSTEAIIRSGVIILLITGAKKRDVIANDKMRLPIHDILTKRPDIKIYYAD
jgi:6-phosphogluconolactonase